MKTPPATRRVLKQGHRRSSCDIKESFTAVASFESVEESGYIIQNENFAKGSYGSISIARDSKTGLDVVLKKIESKIPSKMISNEVRAGQILSGHPNIVEFVQYFFTPKWHCLVLELIKGCDLFQMMAVDDFSAMDESEVKTMFADLVSGLEYSHSHGIAHRDIKLENVLVDTNKHMKYIDFGLCTITSIPASTLENQDVCQFLCNDNCILRDQYLARDYVGSDNYVAPEVMKQRPYCPFKADIFSLGVVLYCMLVGQFPFDHRKRIEAIKKGESVPKLVFPKDSAISDDAKNLLEQMLESDPRNRISVKDLLKHEWVMKSSKPTKRSQ